MRLYYRRLALLVVSQILAFWILIKILGSPGVQTLRADSGHMALRQWVLSVHNTQAPNDIRARRCALLCYLGVIMPVGESGSRRVTVELGIGASTPTTTDTQRFSGQLAMPRMCSTRSATTAKAHSSTGSIDQLNIACTATNLQTSAVYWAESANSTALGVYPDMTLHAGDVIQIPEKLEDWQNQFFAPLEDVGGLQHRSPIIFVPGNHDHDKSRRTRQPQLLHRHVPWAQDIGGQRHIPPVLPQRERGHSTHHCAGRRMPVPGAECVFEARVAVSDHCDPCSALRRVLDPYAWNDKGEKHWDEHIRTEYDPLFRKHGVHLVISGHQHNYQRSTVHRGPGYAPNDSITYAIVGGAGGGLDLKRVEDYQMYNVTYFDHHFVSLDIENKQLHWVARNVAGETIDEFVFQH
ncbi:hypothetical protein DL89DRAFT_273260 [Linderina pennispora]|uniref:Calcineurin-like phosphoesterase domain-containing protein n=1 Tax=Linderina pennispora TaxID=61395 RepID=A0A1Y1VQL5_9FUNG|nr:uncharacterized protein DL89DRAFT_273260 [Linderina pennispora]ORX63560.1 hypothetical protein DL89DRAFT_273260 [Linderina pennispora]